MIETCIREEMKEAETGFGCESKLSCNLLKLMLRGVTLLLWRDTGCERVDR